ncbi:MAG: glutamate 5-kinase [Sulfobacillus acidophilus]|uniref:Glutamate 5-kinase n=1 Tax=Sulfobacillus acidophilus TaxID=53633 RepID=A0A2T2WE40_9FIRM|nr:MAG: glutamate 5-kinase [Sulfobacillus acidophilus]
MRRVIKIGTSTTLTTDGHIDQARLARIAQGVNQLIAGGEQIALVTSGAVGIGRGLVSYTQTNTAGEAMRGALAAIGQIELVKAYQLAFSPISVAQILVDHGHVSDSSAAMALQTALHHLWKLESVPLINENDALSGASRRIGDNDTLAALVAGLMKADQLIILSDIDGLYTDNPTTNPDAIRVAVLPRVSLEHFGQFGDGEPGPWGSGGIVSKLRAAHIAQGFGIETLLAAGHDDTVWECLRTRRYDNFTRFAAHKEA